VLEQFSAIVSDKSSLISSVNTRSKNGDMCYCRTRPLEDQKGIAYGSTEIESWLPSSGRSIKERRRSKKAVS